MADQYVAAQIRIDRDDLERSQDAIHTAQHDLHAILEQMKQSLDAGTQIDPELFAEAEEQMKELEVEANTLRKDLEKLQKQ